MLNVEHSVFTHAGSRIVRQTSPGILNMLLRLTGSSKRCFRTRTQPSPQAIIIRFQNECWMGKDGRNPSCHLDGRKTSLHCFLFEKLHHECSVPQKLSSDLHCMSTISSSSWFSMWSASAFGLSTPASRRAVSLHGWMGHGHGLIPALIRALPKLNHRGTDGMHQSFLAKSIHEVTGTSTLPHAPV